MNKNKLLLMLFFAGILLFFVVIIAAISLFRDTSIQPAPIPESVVTAPTLVPERGRGIDMESEPVQDSIKEIDKLSPFLPYNNQLTLSTGIPVTLFIPQRASSDNPWTLYIGIYGIDYQVNKSDPNYELQKKSFQEATNIVFSWIRSNNVNPEKMYINWGDRTYIQENAEKWLSDK